MFSVSEIQDEGECRNLWRRFVPEQSLFDVWDYRACFFDKQRHGLRFLLITDNQGEVGLLPLWWDSVFKFHDIFGGEFAEPNRLLVKGSHVIPEVFKALPSRTWISGVTHEDVEGLPLVEDDRNFFLDLRPLNYDITSHLSSFSSKHRKNLRHDLSSVSHAILHENRLSDINSLIELNKSRFEESYFHETSFAEGFQRLIAMAKDRGNLYLKSFEIDGTIAAAHAAVLHNGTYTLLLGGNDPRFPNIGKRAILEHLNQAAKLKADKVDLLSTDCNWKRLWNFQEQPLYAFKNFSQEG